MAIGDKSAQSYGWNWTLREAVHDGESVVVPTPGIDLRYTDTEYAEVTVTSNGAVWRTGKGKVDVVFEMNEDDPRATVTNHAGAVWPVGDQLYLFCPHMLGEGHNEYDVKGKIYDIEQRLTALEEAAPPEGGSEERKLAKKVAVEPSKAPPAPVRAAIPPQRAPNSPIRGQPEPAKRR